MGLLNWLFDSNSTSSSSPSVNCDGTPMLDSTIDVEGKIYGDCGSSSCSSIGTGIDSGFSSGCGTDDSFSSSCGMDDSFGTGCGMNDW